MATTSGDSTTNLRVVDPRREPLGDDYDELVRRSANPSFFLSSTWTNTWVETFGDLVDVWALRVERNETLIGAATLALESGGWPSRLRRLTVAGQTPTTGEHLDVVARPGDEATVATMLARELTGRRRRRWDTLAIQRMRADSPVLDHLRSALVDAGCTVRIDETGSSSFTELPDEPDHLLRALSKNFRGQVNQSRNRLGRRGEVDVVVAGVDVGVDEAMDEMRRLHALRWGDDSPFLVGHKAAFHRRLAPRLIERGELYLALLRVDGTPVAARYDFVFADKLWCMQGGWDPDYAETGVGTVATEAAMQWGIEQGLDEYDFLAGDAGYKNRWSEQGRELVTFVAINRRTIRGRLYERLRS